MADELPPPSDSEILAHDAWVRRVVRRLVKDPHIADDLAQEAHEAHLRGGGGDVRETRKWLGGVVRNREGCKYSADL